MASKDSILVRHALGRGIVKRVLDDTPVAFRARYVGTGTVTSVTVTTATNIVFITSDGGTDTYAFATYTTMGALVDAINSDGIFQVRILDALRADSTTSSPLVNGAITAATGEDGYRIWDALVDTSVFKALTARIVPEVVREFTGNPKDHRVSLKEIRYNVNVSAAEAKAVRVYQVRGYTETLIWSAKSVDATLTTITFAGGYGKITGADKDELVIRVLDATSVTDGADNFLEVVGYAE